MAKTTTSRRCIVWIYRLLTGTRLVHVVIKGSLITSPSALMSILLASKATQSLSLEVSTTVWEWTKFGHLMLRCIDGNSLSLPIKPPEDLGNEPATLQFFMTTAFMFLEARMMKTLKWTICGSSTWPRASGQSLRSMRAANYLENLGQLCLRRDQDTQLFSMMAISASLEVSLRWPKS